MIGGVVAVGHGSSAGGSGLRHAVLQIVAVLVSGIGGHVAVGVVSGVGLEVRRGIDGDRERRGVRGGLLCEIAEAVVAVRLATRHRSGRLVRWRWPGAEAYRTGS